jgi:hypothetical protein
MTGSKFSPKEIEELKKKLDNLNEDAAGIIQLAADTAPDMKVWGLVGMIPAAIYWKVAGQDTMEHLKMMGEGLKDNALRVDAAGKTYKAAEDGMAAALKRVEGVINDTPMPGY